jgi:DNA-binding CsgD family transcriptional regulator
MHRNVTRIFHDKIKRFSAPLVDYFGVSHFYFYRITNEGFYTGVGLNPEFGDYFFSENLPIITPFYRHPDNFESGIIFHKAIKDKKWENVLQIAEDKFKINFCCQLINKTNNGIEVFDFALNSPNPVQHMTFINELPLVKLFIDRFLKEFNPFSILENNQIDIAQIIGPSFQKISPFVLSKKSQRDQFLEKMKIEVPGSLTKKEITIIEHLIKGFSASQIANAMILSKRTIEHHLERIKDKFFCHSKSDLIEKVMELKSINCLR